MRVIILAILFVSIFFNTGLCQIDTIFWEQKSSLPSNIIQGNGSACFLIDSDFYVAGGWNDNPVNGLWKYHIPSDTWSQLGNLPFGAAAAQGASFVLNGEGYFLTSVDSINSCDTMLWEYNPVGDSWIRKANFPDYPRQNSSYFSYGGMGYVGFTGGCSAGDNHLWQYDPILDKWTQMATLASYTASGRATAINSAAIAYFIGGTSYSSGNSIGDIWRYSITTNAWDSLGQMPGIPRGFSVFWAFDSILIGGGGTDFDTLFNDFYSYNISQNTWTPVVFQNSFDSTGAGSAFIFGKTGYFFGGISSINPNETYNNHMWSFDASKFLIDTAKTKDTNGIQEIKNKVSFSLYPNPTNRAQGLSISTSESGDIVFYDALGRTLDDRKLVRGLNQVKLSSNNEVVFYKATLQDGATENGKVVMIR